MKRLLHGEDAEKEFDKFLLFNRGLAGSSNLPADQCLLNPRGGLAEATPLIGLDDVREQIAEFPSASSPSSRRWAAREIAASSFGRRSARARTSAICRPASLPLPPICRVLVSVGMIDDTGDGTISVELGDACRRRPGSSSRRPASRPTAAFRYPLPTAWPIAWIATR